MCSALSIHFLFSPPDVSSKVKLGGAFAGLQARVLTPSQSAARDMEEHRELGTSMASAAGEQETPSGQANMGQICLKGCSLGLEPEYSGEGICLARS